MPAMKVRILDFVRNFVGRQVEWAQLKFWLLTDVSFRLGGGAMFGVIPRLLWDPASPPDGRHRIKPGNAVEQLKDLGAGIALGMNADWEFQSVPSDALANLDKPLVRHFWICVGERVDFEVIAPVKLRRRVGFLIGGRGDAT
jgi:hypothetical protein